MQLESCAPGSLSSSTILQGVVLAGHLISLTKLNEELHHLVENELLSVHPQNTSADILKYKLSAYGRDYLEERGLI